MKAKEKNFYSEINFFKLSKKNNMIAAKLYIITIEMGKVIYLEKSFVAQAISDFSIYKKKGSEKVFTRSLKVTSEVASIETSNFGNNLEILRNKNLNQQIKIKGTMKRIEVFSSNMTIASPESGKIRQKVIEVFTRPGNNNFSFLERSIVGR
jgi:hypothetical protein